MKKLLEKTKFHWDFLKGRYQFLIPKEKQDIEACIHILEEVRRKELNRVSGNSVLDSSAFSGKNLDFQLGACRDSKTNQIIGCMRMTNALEANKIPSSRSEYHLDEIPEELLGKLKIFTRLAVLKPYRKSPAALIIMIECFKAILKEGFQGALMSCEPSLYPMYQRLALRPIGAPHNSSSGGYRIPMVIFLDSYFNQHNKSIAFRWAKKIDLTQYYPIQKWYKELEERHQKTQLGVTHYQIENAAKNIDHIITNGISKKGKRKFLKNTLIVKCKEEDVIISEKDGGKVFGIVNKGGIKVLVEGREVALLGVGEVFGEIAFVLNSNRTATLIAANSETEVLLFSLSGINRLKDQDDKVIIWQNLAKILANRLVIRTSNLKMLETKRS